MNSESVVNQQTENLCERWASRFAHVKFGVHLYPGGPRTGWAGYSHAGECTFLGREYEEAIADKGLTVEAAIKAAETYVAEFGKDPIGDSNWDSEAYAIDSGEFGELYWPLYQETLHRQIALLQVKLTTPDHR